MFKRTNYSNNNTLSIDFFNLKIMKTYIFTILLFFLGVIATAQISLPPFFTNNMVIQRDQKFPVWGKAQPNTIITVQICNNYIKNFSVKMVIGKYSFPKQKQHSLPKTEFKTSKLPLTLSISLWVMFGFV